VIRSMKCLAVPAALVLALAASASASAEDIFMRVTGVHGESNDPRYALSSPLKDFSFSVKTDPTSGKATFDVFEVSKVFDSSSPFMFNHAATHAPISSIRIIVRSDGTQPRSYLQYCLENAKIKTDSVDGSEDGVTERIQIDPGAVELRYAMQKSDGTIASPIYTGWNLVSNASIGFNNNCAGIGN
jgi:type VI protein secretion system component Hcp